MIEVKHVTKRYGERVAVKDLSFKIYNGKIYGLLGPNGAGKSTTMKMMTGCLSPSEGTVRINGFDLFDEPIKAKRYIGYLSEIPALYDELTPMEYLRFVAEAKGVPADRALRQIREAVELTQLEKDCNRLIRHLSKGTRQRVGIAQTLLGKPDFIVLDEPTVGLDPRQIAEIRALIRRLGERKTVLISSHILAEINELCDHVLILSEGELVANAPIEELRGGDGGLVCLQLVVRGDEKGVLDALSAVAGIESCSPQSSFEEGAVALRVVAEPREDLRDSIFFALADRRYAVLSIEREEHTLESIFLSLTDGTCEEDSEADPACVECDGEYELIDDEEEAQ